jgi:2-amino-4-hydroxy-6-hydroxymethyldihydropteridine diphosphokinase
MTSRERVFVALGSNQGEREVHLAAALQALAAHEELEVVACSSVHETEPVGGPAQGPYLNAVAELRTRLTPPALLEVLHGVEAAAGRTPAVRDLEGRWGPRPLDLDLLLYGDRVLPGHREGEPVVPHPRLTERSFVLEPLAELAPDLVVPGTGLSVEVLRARVATPP